MTPRADRTLKSSQLSLPKTKSATPNSVSFQRVRLTFTPRHDAKTARLLVQWLPLETSPQVVWRGAAHRNQPIVATFEAPRQNAKASVGNKNRSAQVSLQVPQGTSARNAWKTVESIVIDSISAIR